MFLAINQNGQNSKKRKREKRKADSSIITPTTGCATEKEMLTDVDTGLTTYLVDNMLMDCSTVPPTAAAEASASASLTTLKFKSTAAAAAAAAAAEICTNCKNSAHELQANHFASNNSQEKCHIPAAAACQRSPECVNKNCSNYAQISSKATKPNSLEPTQFTSTTSCTSTTPTSTSTFTSTASTPQPITSLSVVYIYLGILSLSLATLAILFNAHVHTTTTTTTTTTTAPAQTQTYDRGYITFREQFRRELIASDHVLRSMLAQMLEQRNFQERGHMHANEHSSKKLHIDDKQLEANEREHFGDSGAGITAKRKRRDIASSPSSIHADPFVEFFNPNHRKTLDEHDMEVRKRTGLKGAAPGGDEWVYLNTYCRVPEKMITGFCKGTQDYCPPSPEGPQGPIGPKGPVGLPGLPGIPGPKGNRGDVGLPGPPGIDGLQGPPGQRGIKGDTGIPGRTGLDGRDGVPGEPGLDGVPGRAGADGIPGKDGMPGQDGRDGLNGKDGKDGAPGPKGDQGPPGERGLKGVSGARGRPGKSGTNGTPGIPGINAWKVQFTNGSYSNELLIPPSITDAVAPYAPRTVIVEEGKTLNLSCAATGNPLPHVEWRRDDGRTITINGMELSSVQGQYLKFNNITRVQMAAYTCYANNGIVPVANATFLIEVHFAPMISVYRQMIYAEYGHSATLECLVEAFPDAIRYWERAYDGKILDPGDKYRIETYPDGFKTTMRLTISNLRKDDFGYYHCVARNELNATMVNFEIAPQDPNSETPYVGKEMKVYGQRPPESECPICEQCPDASLLQCKDSIHNSFEIQPTGNYSYPGLPKRLKSCELYAVGKPVFHKALNEIYGCWLKDPAAKESDREKTFVTNENDSFNLFEFSTKMQYRMNSVPRKKYEIREGFHGNAHVVYNGSFYYNQRNTDLVVKLDLETLKKTTTQLPYAGIAAGNKLYSTDYNYMDFNVDEVGLWVIYSTYNSNNTLVAKLDAESLKMQYNFNITLDHRKFGEMFIVCGRLYAIDSSTDRNSQIRYVVDLYNGKLLNTNLTFSNPFRRTTTVGYNPLSVELYSWDKGNALTYPIRYHEKPLGTDHS